MSLQEHFDRSPGGELLEARVDRVDVRDDVYYVIFEGELDSGNAVTSTVPVIGEEPRWRACGVGHPEQIP